MTPVETAPDVPIPAPADDGLNSGQFVYYQNSLTGEQSESIGLVLRKSSNEREDGSTEDWVEVVGPLTVQMVPVADARSFTSPEKKDPKKIVGSKTSDVTGVGQ